MLDNQEYITMLEIVEKYGQPRTSAKRFLDNANIKPVGFIGGKKVFLRCEVDKAYEQKDEIIRLRNAEKKEKHILKEVDKYNKGIEQYISFEEIQRKLNLGAFGSKSFIEKHKIDSVKIFKYLKIYSRHEFDKACESDYRYNGKYYTFEEAKELLMITSGNKSLFNRIMEEYKCEIIKSERGGVPGYVSKDDILNLKEKQTKFWDTHYTSEYVSQFTNLYLVENIRVEIPLYARINTQASIRHAYEKVKFNEYKQLLNKISKPGYITTTEACEMLNVTRFTMRTIADKYNLERELYSNKYFYIKSQIETLVKEQQELFKKYISTTEAIEKYKSQYPNITSILWHTLDGIDIPPICCISDYSKTISRQSKFYDRKELENIVSRRVKSNNLNNTFGDTLIDTFNKRLNIYIDDISTLTSSKYTFDKWSKFVESKLYVGNRSITRGDYNKVNRFVNMSININQLLEQYNVSEVYSLDTQQMLMGVSIFQAKRSKYEFVYFLREIYYDINYVYGERKTTRGFNLAEIEKVVFKKCVRQNTTDKESSDIYDYNTYKRVFEHLINVKLHIERILKLDAEESKKYLSTWLYVLLHLNNAWRHGDVTRFPRLYIDDILEEWGINDLAWYKTNSISVEQSRRIISRIIQYDYRISKTETYGHFFCSDKLAPAIATVVTMLECCIQKDIISIDKAEEKMLMYFGTKFNEPTETYLKKIFSKSGIKGFKFSSKKMNKTVMTLIYNTACAITPSGYNLLLLPKYLRNHAEEMSTIQYIQFSEEQLEFLGGELFERGSFGFITDKLLNLVSSIPEDSKERTDNISQLNTLFGGIKKIEAVVGMLNSFNNEQEEIFNEILHYLNQASEIENLSEDEEDEYKSSLIKEGYTRCIEVISNIYMQNLPSRQEDIQCIFSETGCRNPECEKCYECKYHIPSIYALRAITQSLKEEMIEFFRTPQLGKRIRLSSKIDTKVMIIIEAINRYGHEYVYNCIDMSRDEFIEMFNNITEVDELLKLR